MYTMDFILPSEMVYSSRPCQNRDFGKNIEIIASCLMKMHFAFQMLVFLSYGDISFS